MCPLRGNLTCTLHGSITCHQLRGILTPLLRRNVFLVKLGRNGEEIFVTTNVNRQNMFRS